MRFSSLAIVLIFFIPQFLYAQNEDCVTAEVICTDGAIVFNPTGPGINDFSDPDNDPDCLLSDENQSGWYYFEFRADMPPNSIIEFTVNPDGGFGEDYDFAIYGPDLDCENLGTPLRCSYASSACAFCPQTGLGNGATDFSESASGDGYVAPLTVQPGQGFYLLLDNWLGSSTGFSLEWGGSAAPFLNCEADPTCDLELTPGDIPPACAGDSPISIPMVVLGNMGGEVYSWTAPSPDINFLSSTTDLNPIVTIPDDFSGTLTYTLTVTEDDCDATAVVTIDVSGQPDVSITGPMAICEDVDATLNATPGFSSYAWSTGDSTPDITVDQPGSYSVTVTDANGCSNDATFDLTVNMLPEVTIDGPAGICEDISATLSATPGFSSYAWSTGDSTPDITVDQTGTYSVTVTDANGCMNETSVDLTVAPLPEVTITGPDEICEQQAATLSATPGYATYSWSTGDSTPDISVNQPGNYSVTITDANGCMNETSFDLIVLPLPEVSITGPESICEDMTATLSATPGHASYSWSTGDTTPNINVNASGTYSVTVTDANGCENEASFDFTVFPPPSLVGGTVEICQNGAAFIMPVSVSNVMGGEFYSWTATGQGLDYLSSWTEPNPTVSIPAGFSGSITYTLTVTEGDCESMTDVVVTVSPLPVVEITGPESICGDLEATLSATPGFVAYQWSTGDNAPDIVVNQSGTYTVTVTDVNGCQNETSFDLEVLPTPVLTPGGPLEVCAGDDPFQLPMSVANVTGLAVYSWTATGPGLGFLSSTNILNPDLILPDDFTGLLTYQLTVSENGCSDMAEISIFVYPQPVLGIDAPASICTGETATLSATPGYADYQWSNGVNDQNLNVNQSGTYTVTVTDVTGCQSEATVDLEVFPLPNPVIDGTGFICEGASTELTVTPEFEAYSWSNGATGQTASFNEDGVINVLVTDENGCQNATEFTIEDTSIPPPEILGDPIICPGISTTLSTVESYFEYSWSTGETSDQIEVTEGNTYSVTITDENGCVAESSFLVEQAPELSLSISGDDALCAGDMTTLTANGNFTSFVWSTTATSQTIETGAGNFSVTATDEFNCVYTDSINVENLPLPEPEITGLTTFCLDAFTTISVGESYDSYIWSNDATTQSIEVDTEGIYSVTVTDGNNCSASTSVEVLELEQLQPGISGDLEFCAGSSTLLTGENGYSSYLWSTGEATPSITVTAPGDYTLSVTDANGCEGSTTVPVIENQLPIPEINTQGYFCESDSVLLNVDNIYIAYAWFDGDTTNQIYASVAGDYSVTVTDGNGCKGFTTTTIEEIIPSAPQIEGPFQFCPGTSTTLTGENGFVDYQWENGPSTQEMTVTAPGDYTLNVIDDYGYPSSTTVDVTEFIINDPVISGPLFFCPNTETELSGNTGFANYSWSNGTSGQTSVFDQTGIAALTVTDFNGCITSSEVTLDEFEVIPPQITGDTAFCAGQSVVLNGENGYVTYDWSDGQTGQSITVTTGGPYTLSVEDMNGCFSNSSILITENPLPEPQILGSATFCIGSSSFLSADQVYTAYNWSDGSTVNNIEVNIEGTYGLTVTDSFGCIDSTDLTVTQETELQPSIAGPLAYCENENTILDAGPGYATYTWSTGATTQTITVSNPGTYGLTVTDLGGCNGDSEVDVIENPLPNPNISGILEYCFNESTTIDAGAGFNNYQWSTGDFLQTLQIENPGNYTVTVTDQNGCINSDMVTVTENPLPVIDINGQFYFCEDDLTTISVTAGFPTYLWSTGQNDASIDINTEGTYYVTVTDDNGCQSNTDEFIEEIPLPIALAGGDQFLDCDTDEVTLPANNSTQGTDFIFNWTGPGINASNINDITPVVTAAGTYQLFIEDEIHGCISDLSTIDVTDLAYEPVVLLEVVDELDCITETVLINGSGSTSGNGITYQWFDGAGELIHNAFGNTYLADSPQSYTLLVIDTLTACAAMDSIEVYENFEYPISEAGPDGHLDCVVQSVELNANGSQLGNTIIYQWESQGGNILSGSTGLIATVNAPGFYYLTVMDTDNGCSNIDSVMVTQDVVFPVADAGEDQQIDCHTAFVQLNGNGSSSGSQYELLWSQQNNPGFSATTPLLTVDNSGVFNLLVTNTTNGCTSQDQVVVVQGPAAPTDLTYDSSPPTCFGDADGSLIIQEVSGGQAPYLYDFNGEGPQPISAFTNLTAGIYEVLVTDANDCEFYIDLELEDGNDLILDLGEDQVIELGDAAEIYALFNIPEDEILSFTWNPDPDITCDSCYVQEPTPSATTTYSATLVDENGCYISDFVNVFVQKNRNIFIPNVFSPNHDGNNDVFMIFSGKDVFTIRSFNIFNRWGEPVYQIYNFPPNNPEFGWDGRFRDRPMNSAVFVWYAEVEFVDGEVLLFKGDVTLVR